MKKVIISICMLFLLSGCDVQYELEYKNSIFKESVSVTGSEKDDTTNIRYVNLLNVYNQAGLYVDYKNNDAGDVEIVGDKYNISLFNEGYGINFNYKFNTIGNYSNSPFIQIMYDNFVINDDGIHINSSHDIYNLYPNLNNITLKFITDKKINEANADKVENNIYYWYINKNNYKTKKIDISFFHEEENEEKYVDNGYLTYNFMNYFLVIVLVIILIIVLIVYNKVKNSNKKW